MGKEPEGRWNGYSSWVSVKFSNGNEVETEYANSGYTPISGNSQSVAIRLLSS